MSQSRSGPADQPELRLLLACARTRSGARDGTAIRRMLDDGIDWAAFARKAIKHGIAGLVGDALEEMAPDLVPNDLRNAFRMSREHIRAKNEAILEGFRRTTVALANHGIEAIWFDGPVLGLRVYGDLQLRTFGTPTLLIREQAASAAVQALRDIGYERRGALTEAQLALIRHLEGEEILSNPSFGIMADVCIRLTPLNTALAIDHAGLWRRAQRASGLLDMVRTLAPEDEVVALSIRHARAGTWQLGEACDFAGLIASQPGLDRNAVIERARSQACLRMLAFALALAGRFFGARVGGADRAGAGEQPDPMIEAMMEDTVAHWRMDGPSGSAGEGGASGNVLRLYDGRARKAQYIVRSLVLPESPHVSRVALPRPLSNLFVYGLIKVAQEAAILPLLRTYRQLRARPRRNAARPAVERVLAENPGDAAAWEELGDALFRRQRQEAAIAAYDKALASAPESPMLWSKRAAAIASSGGRLSHLDTEAHATLNPDDASAWARHAASLIAAKRFAEAAIVADKALAIDPGHLMANRVGIRSRILSCDWRRSEEDERRVADAYKAAAAILTPAGNRAICDSEEQNLIAAQLWARPFVRPPGALPRRRKYAHDRIRLAYLCSEYHDHPVGRQIVGVLEHHDRSRFETTAISLDGPNSSAIRQRIEAACEKFISVPEMNDEQVANLVSKMEIDIAVDLDRFASRARPGILARRPAALQVTYFGNAGTTGAPFIDYIVADRTLIPGEQLRNYTEKVIYLPNSYQCNDSKRQVPQSTPSRAEAGLPEEGFVYCCFNQHYKIRPAVFDVWMRLLNACPGSVLWLLGGDSYVIDNLRREAVARGIGSERIVFAPWVANDEHMARHRLADLFLDTLPCNAHATASDALWAGLPMLTCLGNTFAGRVGASLLRAVGLPEMVTESLSEYEALAISLARDRQRLAAIKAKLAQNRHGEPLFDTAGFTRDLEAAFAAIWRRQQAGMPPEAIGC